MERKNREILKISYKRLSSPVAYCALTAKSGTRDENPIYNGLAHFTEHMLFKGTQKRGAASINNLLEKVGGELNAYTTKEETVLHATVLKEDISKAVNLLFEIAFTSIFPKKEIEKEREVILDEIVSYKDLPAEAIYDNFEQLLFKGHPLEMQILGEKKSLNKINSEVFLKYLQTAFSPKNIVFTIMADLPENKVLTMVKKGAEKYFGEEIQLQLVKEGDGFNLLPDKNSPSQTTTNKSLTISDLSVGRRFNETIGKKNHQAHCIIGASAYSCMNEKRIPLALLVNIIGGPASNSLLNMVLREKNALVYNVEANYTPYLDTGIFTVYFGCDKADVEKCLDLIKKEFGKLVLQELKEAALKGAKKQLLGQLSIAQDNAEAQCLSMGKSLAVYGKISNLNQMRLKIEAISAKELQEVAGEVLSWDRLSILIYR